jgi:hypothetical protein
MAQFSETGRLLGVHRGTHEVLQVPDQNLVRDFRESLTDGALSIAERLRERALRSEHKLVSKASNP